MNEQKTKMTNMDWLEAAPVEWDAAVNRLNAQEREELARWLDAVCQHAARLSGYLDARGVLGCGDSGHSDGVERGNRKVARVRRALGYTHVRKDLSF